MRGARAGDRAIAAACVLILAACGGGASSDPLPPRHARFGVLRDLVLVTRPTRLGGPFFLDVFETTCADFRAWLETDGTDPEVRRQFAHWNRHEEGELPVVGIDLATARRFARWRFGRLPRVDEWRWAASAGGRHTLPWGDAPRSTWANSAHLGLSRLAPVGAFESGRSPDGAYDLVGNAAEWTETPTPTWSEHGANGEQPLSLRSPSECSKRLFGRAAARVWRGVPAPTFPLVVVDSAQLPRLVVAGYDAALPRARPGDPADILATDVDVRMPTGRSSNLGMRVASDPDTLLDLITRVVEPLSGPDRAMLRAFLRRRDVRAALTVALRGQPEIGARETPVARIVREELGG